MAEILAINAALVAVSAALLWLISIRLKDASIIDIFWGPGFGLIAIATLLQTDEPGPVGLLLAALTVLWSVRLGSYLAGRWLAHGRREDSRYVSMRRKAGPGFALRSLVTVFALQAALMWIVALPLQIGIANSAQATLGLLSALGCLLFLAGFTLEAIADVQLKDFKADPANAGKILQQGVWAWSRHPNYFGNACLWWGLYLIAASAPYAALTVVSPALMTFLLLRVSGVALLERRLTRSLPDYVEYKQAVNTFMPLPPKRKRHKQAR